MSKREIYMPIERRHMTRSYILRLSAQGKGDGRYFRCDCCGATREVCEAHTLKAKSRRLKLEKDKRYEQHSRNLVVCATCDKEWSGD